MPDVLVLWAAADAPPDLARLLDADEVERMSRFRREQDRAMFLAAHALARVVAGEINRATPDTVSIVQRCERCGGPHGRPTSVVGGVPGPSISFSHAGGRVIAAGSDHELGIDLEPLDGPREDIAEIALSPSEQSRLAARPTAERAALITRWWVRKEAVLKATGHGLEREPRLVEVTPPWEPPEVVGEPKGLHLVDVDVGAGFAATLAVAGPHAPSVTARRWRW